MKPLVKQALLTGAMAAAALAAFLLFYERTGTKIPPKVFDDMAFPADIADSCNPETGQLIHEAVIRLGDRPEYRTGCHVIPDFDCRHKSETEMREAVKAHVRNEAKEMGIACLQQDWRLIQDAWAQPHCGNDCGGGCSSHTCGGTQIGQTCNLGGTSCLVTVICCPSCPPSCD